MFHVPMNEIRNAAPGLAVLALVAGIVAATGSCCLHVHLAENFGAGGNAALSGPAQPRDAMAQPGSTSSRADAQSDGEILDESIQVLLEQGAQPASQP